MNNTKICTKCKKEKELSKFYKDKRKKDGYYSSCKSCKNKDIERYQNTEIGKKKIRKNKREYGIKHKDKINLQKRKSYRKNRDKILVRRKIERKKNREKFKISQNKFRCSEKGRRYYREYKIEYKKNNLEKIKANLILKNAIRKGEIIRPRACTICEKTGCRIEGHHDDYIKALEVVWCCKPCHSILDKERRKREENYRINNNK